MLKHNTFINWLHNCSGYSYIHYVNAVGNVGPHFWLAILTIHKCFRTLNVAYCILLLNSTFSAFKTIRSINVKEETLKSAILNDFQGPHTQTIAANHKRMLIKISFDFRYVPYDF